MSVIDQSRWDRGDPEAFSKQWKRDVAAFLASRRREARDVRPPSAGQTNQPRPLADEREVLAIYASHWLYQVTGRPGGYRLVGLVVGGTSHVWDLPGYNQRDAQTMCVNLVDGYL